MSKEYISPYFTCRDLENSARDQRSVSGSLVKLVMSSLLQIHIKEKDGPTYSSPVPREFYEKVHEYRQAEIKYAVTRLSEIPFIDTSKMFLMGNSEGAFAAARYAGKEFKGRMILS